MKLHNKTSKSIFWGFLFIAAAVLIVLDAVNIMPELPLVKIVLGIIMGAWLVSEILKLRVKGMFFPAAFLFMIFECDIGTYFGVGDDIISNWIVLLAAFLLTIGTHLITGSGVPKSRVTYGGLNAKRDKNSFSAKTCYVDCNGFKYRIIENSFGAYEVFFQNNEMFEGDAVMEIANNFGQIELNIPAEWNVKYKVKNTFGNAHISGKANVGGKLLTLVGSNSFGNVRVRFI